jgi:serine protease inhibitor
MQELQTKYNSDIIYDAFITPNKINDWTKEKTNGMIPKLIDQLDPEFVLGVANAIAIDVEWQQKFECESTREGEFKVANETKKVEMMHKTYESGTKYFKTENAEGVIIPYASYDKETGEMTYENGKQLEFIGILPNNDVKEYISNLDANELQNIDNNTEASSRTVNIKVSLPRFTYDFDYKKFALLLHNLGMTKAFDPANADFTNIITRENHEKAGLNNIYVGEAIHMTHIELNESGTKAAAVTAFLLKDNAAIFEEEIKYINVNFNKPFIYMIRDKETKDIIFAGAVYSPNEWTKSTCDESN